METVLEKDEIMNLTNEELEHFKDLAVQFSKKSLLPMFEGEFSDGNLEMLPGILDITFETGLASSPDETMAGCEYGIWGSSTDSSGLLSSIELLTILGETCGGVAMCLHAQGVASNLLLTGKNKLPESPKKVALCFQEGFIPPYCGTIFSPEKDLPAAVTTTAKASGSGYELNGTKSFVYSMENPDVYVVLARIDDKWGCFAVPSNAKGVTIKDVGNRSGLRAATVNKVDFDSVSIPETSRIDDGDALDMVKRALTLNLIGMSAISVGIAKGAVASAKQYASERYQGGGQIEEHAIVKMLIAGSEALAMSAESTVQNLQNIDLTSNSSLRACAAAKLVCTELCAKATTDTLQSFGGYGYMEDFGMEKRLRDVTVLKSASGSPNYLKQLIFDLEKVEA